MTTPCSGTIYLSDVDIELNRPPNALIYMGNPEERELAGVPTGTIWMSDFYCKSSEEVYIWTGTGAAAGINLSVFALFGSPTKSKKYIFYNNGELGNLSTGVFPAGSTLFIINNGRIQGAGGKGGWYNSNKTNTLPTAGGNALTLQFPTTLTNNSGLIFGGGGGGGGSAEWGGENDNNAPGGGGAGIPVGVNGDYTWSPGYTYRVSRYPTYDLGGTNTAGVGPGGNRGAAGTGGSNVGSTDNRKQPGAAAGIAIVNTGFLL